MHSKGIPNIVHSDKKGQLDRAEALSSLAFAGVPRLLVLLRLLRFSHLSFFYQLRLQGKSLHPSTIPAQVHGFHTGGDETAELRILRQSNTIGLPAEQGGACRERVPAALALWLECLDEPHL